MLELGAHSHEGRISCQKQSDWTQLGVSVTIVMISCCSSGDVKVHFIKAFISFGGVN